MRQRATHGCLGGPLPPSDIPNPNESDDVSERAAVRRRRKKTSRRRGVLIGGLVVALGAGAVTGGVLMTASASGPGAGTYHLVNAADSTCVTAPSAAAGTRLATAACANTGSALTAQTWQLADSDGGFAVKSADGTMCAGAKGASTSAGKAVQLQACDGSSAQVWKPTAVGNAYHLVNAKSAKCLNVKAGLLQQNSCDKASTKSWTLVGKGDATPTKSATPSASATKSPSPSPSVSASASATKSPSATPSTSAPATKTPTAAPPATGGTTTLGAWPTPTGKKAVSATIAVSGTYDGGLARFYGSGGLGGDSQSEGQDPLFELADGAVLKNVVLGSPAADGVHCLGSCTLQNVWWEDVGEDAASFKGKSASAKYVVDGGGARKADDKVLQFNGAGTLTIKNFQVEAFGKLVRSCGNCSTQYQRHIVLSNVKATAPGNVLVGVNANFGDTATLSGVTVVGDKDITLCERFKGNDSGDEPTSLGSGADGTHCKYSESAVAYK